VDKKAGQLCPAFIMPSFDNNRRKNSAYLVNSIEICLNRGGISAYSLNKRVKGGFLYV
jgi:hypothetical protein